MVNGEFYFAARANDLCLERRDPGVQFLDGQAVQILRAERRGGIGGLAGQDVVEIHGGNVDPRRTPVNKARDQVRVPGS